MTYRFTARAAGGDEELDEDYRDAGVAEFEDGTGFTLVFMSGIEEADDQDVDLGLDTYCLVTADQGTAYGCVREVAIRDDTLRVVLDPAALQDLGLDDPVIEAVLDVPEADVNRMREVLRSIFSYGRADARPVLVDL
ncbi:Imm10 family immunity protein [Microbispora siamensis]|uniref:Immunity protein 10 n=1 Tax=Microbispora siamensis TaxID=564413 RepID=A0ABQ4GN64_9ACTN|nr:Imm10 family immunity protein [Microbispora siamensis]GIH62871.1 hypothetical protein Msi02_36880 [Microbispora siamensis]